MTYPDPVVADLLNENFVPVQLDLSQSPDLAHRYQVIWTPNLNVLDDKENLAYHAEGWLPPADFAAMLYVAKGHFEMRHKKYEKAITAFEGLVEKYPSSEFAPEAVYYLGTCRYLASHDVEPLKEQWNRLMRAYPASTWALRANIL